MSRAKSDANAGLRNEYSVFRSLITVLKSLDAAVWVIGKSTNQLLFANDKAEQMFAEAKPGKADTAVPAKEPPTEPDWMLSPVAHKTMHDGEYWLACGDQNPAMQTIEIDWPDHGKAYLTIERATPDFQRIKDALMESDARFKATLDNAAHAIVLTDETGQFTQVNEAWEKMFGYTADEAMHLTHLDITHPEFLEISVQKLSALIGNDLDFYRMEKKFIRKNGEVFWGELSVTPINLPDRRVGAAVGVIADISDRIKMGEALQQSEALFRATMENLAQAVTLTDSAGRFTRVNAAFEQMFGYTAAQAKTMNHLDITHPDDIATSNEKLQSLIRGELDFYRMEKRYIRKDGSVFWGDITCTPILSFDKSIAAAVAVIVDISEQKEARAALQKAHDQLENRVAERTEKLANANQELLEQIAERNKAQEALKRSEERFRAIFETASDCIFIKDLSLKYTLVNPAMEKLLDMSAAEVMQCDDYVLFGRATGDYLQNLGRRVLTGEIIEAEHMRPVRGMPMKFLDVFAPMRDEHGDIVGICGISRNITERSETVVKELPRNQVKSAVMQSALAEARLAAGTDIIILLTGESGAGKDYLARFIHDHSGRSSGPYYTINCAAIPPELAEAELFGHERGAFTGANRLKRGLLELAEGGTLLLNEIGELPLHLQAKLLTFLDQRSFTRIGGEKPVTVSARLIAATNRNLESEVAQNRFRLDLFYRLNVLSIRVPPLRERIEDLPMLAHRIIAELKKELQLTKQALISTEDMAKLSEYSWQGNIRELRNVLERALIVSPGEQLQFDFLNTDAQTTDKSWTFQFPPRPSYHVVIDELKRNLLQEALSRAGGNKQAACRLLGISRHMLRRQLERFNMDAPKRHTVETKSEP